MRRRPVGLLVLAWFHALIPGLNFFWVWFFLGLSPLQYIETLSSQSLLLQAEYFLLLPLAGYAVYRVRSWSLPVFFGIVSWCLYRYFNTAWFFPHILKPQQIFMLVGFNILTVLYLVRTSVRAPFFNAKLRWWEAQERFVVAIPARLLLVGNEGTDTYALTGTIADFSLGGVFMTANWNALTPKMGDKLQLTFKFFAFDFCVRGRVTYCKLDGARPGIGVCWYALDSKIETQIKNTLFGLKALGIPTRNRVRTTLIQEIQDELSSLVKDIAYVLGGNRKRHS